MEKLNIILSNGLESTVDCLFYLYNSKYYFIYTTKEIDENGYVVLHLVQVGREIQNTPNGPIDTGNMVGVEISDPEEWKSVQSSISKIIEDAKNGTTSPEILILPLSMITKLRIVNEKTFRLMKDIVVDALKIYIPDTSPVQPTVEQNMVPTDNLFAQTPVQPNIYPAEANIPSEEDSTVIIDYRAKFFEEQEKNNELQRQIDELNQKILDIKNIIEPNIS